MKLYNWHWVWLLPACAGCGVVLGQDVVINEIMYHPASENVLEEFIELYNPGPTNVSLTGWRLTGGVDFLFPSSQTIAAGGYLVVAANVAAFTAKYPGVPGVVGGWQGILSNSRNAVNVEDAEGQRIDSVTYSDEGDWAVRQRGPYDNAHYGWIWYKEHDGLGKSLELINPAMPNQYGQNWASSVQMQGTPGQPNSVLSGNIAPLILDVTHHPLIPTSADPITVNCRILDEQASGLTVRLRWRIDSSSPPAFSVTNLLDNGQRGDGVANDGLYGVRLGPFADDTVIEFYVEAVDAQGLTRTWPAAAKQVDYSLAQTANALVQVEDNPYTGEAPLYKLIMTTAEYNELGDIFNNYPASDAQMNATFIALEGTGTDLRYLVGVRNRGHGSRYGTPHNYRIDFHSDEPWLNAVAINVNARTVYNQHIGAVLAQKAGAVGGDSRAIQLRVNNGAGPGGTPTYGHYAANEVLDSHWAENHFPLDGSGNVYRVVRDVRPCNFDYRGTNVASYRNTYFKHSNESEDDWSDLISMLQIMGENSGDAFTTESAQAMVHVEQWLVHMAVMSFFGNNESGLNTGNNDDYYLYSGAKDRRFILAYHDLDQILGTSSLAASTDIFRATCCPISGDTEGSWRAMNRFMRWPEFEPIYYATVQRLLDTVFSQAQFDPLVDQTLGHYVPQNVRDNIKSWMSQRRSSVQSQITGHVPGAAGFATITGEPRSPTWLTTVTLLVGGNDIVSYRYRLNNGVYSQETPVAQSIRLTGLSHDSTNTLFVFGKRSNGAWQSDLTPTVSRTWVVNTNTPKVSLSEVLARNDTAVNHYGTYPDLIELFNEFLASVDLGGMRLTDDPSNPDKFVFPAGTTIGPRGYLVLYANNPDQTPGLHLGFSLDQKGEGVYLYDSAARGGRLVDYVEFGNQLPDLSIGRVSLRGVWTLNTPTFGTNNVTQATGDPSLLKINEWLTSGASPFLDDFIEIYNPGLLPVDLSQVYLTDNPIGVPLLNRIREATFVPAQGFVAFIADGDSAKAGHVGFQLSSAQGRIALFDQWQQNIDYIEYGPQKTGVSVGRCSDGEVLIQAQALPTPGAGNACPTDPVQPQLVNIIPLDHTWKYEASGANLGTEWLGTNYSDSSWNSGQTLIGFEQAGDVPLEPIRTLLTGLNGRVTTYYRTRFDINPNLDLSALQITHLIDDGAVFYVNGTEVGRFNIADGPIDFNTIASTVANAEFVGPLTVPLNLAKATNNLLAVELHQNNLNSADQEFGLRLDAIIVTNNAGSSGVVINEVLASNATTLQDPDGTTPDLVELYNPSAQSVNLAGLVLADGLAEPRQAWVFPTGSSLAGRGYLTIRFDPDHPVSVTNAGFALSASKDSLYLLDNPTQSSGVLDVIHFGLQIPDYSLGRLPDGSTNWVLTLPTLGSANIVAPLGDPAAIKVNEWMANPASGDDWFELYNPNGLPVAIGGFYLTDNLAVFNQYQPIPDYSFLGASTNGWQKFVADKNLGAGADHVDFNLKAEGEAIGLFRRNGSQIDAITFVAQLRGVSEGRIPDGSGAVVAFPETASPGERNYLFLTNVVVNEVLTHTDPPLEDAIELHNPTAELIDIGGWWLSDSKSSLFKYQIPAGTKLSAGGFQVFYEYRLNDGDFAAIPFSLSSAKGDEVHLTAAPGGIPNGFRHTAQFGPAANGVSFGRQQTSVGVDFVSMSQRTFGVDNPATVEQFRLGQGLPNAEPLVGPIVITEIMYHPPDLGTNDNVRDEFVELHNITTTTVQLYDTLFPSNTWRTRKGVDFDFPPGSSIPAGGFVLLVSFDPANDPAARAAFEARYGSNLVLFGPYSGKLDNGGEAVELQRPDSPQTTPGPDFGLVPYITVEHIRYSDQAPWPVGGDGDGLSLQRINPVLYGNDPANWRSATPTPEPGTGGMADTDGDGMPDVWEIQHGLNPNQNDANNDLDSDGLTNLEEFQVGTDPSDPSSLLQVDFSGINEGVAIMRFTAIAGRTYSLLYQDSLGIGNWQALTNVPVQSIDREITVVDPAAGVLEQRFYMLVTPAKP